MQLEGKKPLIKGRSFNQQAPTFAGSRFFPEDPPNVIPVTEEEAKDLLNTRGVRSLCPSFRLLRLLLFSSPSRVVLTVATLPTRFVASLVVGLATVVERVRWWAAITTFPRLSS